MKPKRQRNQSPDTILKRLTAYVVKNFDYFREHPVHLAWAMMNYQLIHRIGRRYVDEYSANPKYLLIEQESVLSPDDANLLYDAWGITVSNYDLFPDSNPNLPLDAKQDKTLDEWVEVLTNPLYTFNDLYRNRWRVIDRILCVNGSGMIWNKDGFVCRSGPSDVDESIYYGYTRCEKDIDPEIYANVMKYRQMLVVNPKVGKKLEKYLALCLDNAKRIDAGEDYFEVLNPKLEKALKVVDPEFEAKMDALEAEREARLDKEIHVYPISKGYCLLDKMPNNAHPSYIKAGLEICEVILNGTAIFAGDWNLPEYRKGPEEVAQAFMDKWKPKTAVQKDTANINKGN